MQYLGNKDKKNLMSKLPKGYEISKKDELKRKDNILYKGKDKFMIISDSGEYLPHLKTVPNSEYKSVYVDRGAIPFIIKGADLMRPGISKIDSGILKDDIILIRDEEHNKNLAIGFSLFDSTGLESQEKGKSVKIYHYFNDDKY